MTPEEIEARKKLATLRLGGILITATICVVALPQLVPWVWPPLLIAAFMLVAGAVLVIYDRLVLDKPVARWGLATPIILAAMFTVTAMADGIMRQVYRLDDCLRFESEIVSNPEGDRADAANAFQALRCMPSGGIVDRIWGPSKKLEADVRDGRGEAKRLKDGVSHAR